ncbi:MAG TPA: insulinase family protein [Gemmatimonadaceae bacterium]|nr:insulinase family protein [Gemmatimonadaceae bacterium]
MRPHHIRRSAAILLVASTALAAGCSTPPASSHATVSPVAEDIPADTAVATGVLPNGLRYYVRRNAKPEKRAELRLVVNAGSVLEDDDQRGLAHFLEHMAFNGTEHFQKHEIVDYLQSVGMRFGNDLNAGTNYDETIYQFTVPTDTTRILKTGLDILGDWAHAITLDPKEIEAERGVVLEEWRGRRGAGARIMERHDSVLFQGSPYAERLPIGLPERIKTAQRPEIARFYHDWYRPDLMAVVAVGDFDKDSVVAAIRSEFGAIPAASHPRPRPSHPLPDNHDPLVSIVTDTEATGSSVQVLYKLAPRTDEGTIAAYRRSLVESLFHRMLQERLNEIAQRSDAPFLSASSATGTVVRATTVHSFTASVPENGIETGLKALLTELERVAQHGFTPAEFERAKTSVLRGYESRYAARAAITSGAYAQSYISNYLTGAPIPSVGTSLSLARELLPKIELADVNAIAPVWRSTENRVVLATLPRKAGLRVPTREGLLAIFDSVRAMKLAPYQESLKDAPLVAAEPKPGAVVKEQQLDSVGAREWTLANGVHVILKPTDFNLDQIAITGYGPGGVSLAPDSLFLDARFATSILSVGGLADFSRNDLQKRLAGKVVSVGASIDDAGEGISASGSPRNMDTIFQLLYLQFTAPRVDTAAVAAYKKALRSNLANRSASPGARFADSIVAVMTQHNWRARPITTAMVDSLDARKALAFFRDRFADASDFTFVIVGAFDPDSIRPLVERYIGGLPSLGRHEAPVDMGIRPPTGVVHRMVLAGTEPKADTRLYFTGTAPVTPEREYVLNALAQVLQRRLTERLREEMGGTYSPSVGTALTTHPLTRYEITVAFGSAPERVDELTRAVLATIHDLQQKGPTAQEVHDVAEQQERGRETGLRQNGYWLSMLASYAREGWDFASIAAPQPPGGGQALTADAIQRAAKEYLTSDNYVQLSLAPAPTVN